MGEGSSSSAGKLKKSEKSSEIKENRILPPQQECRESKETIIRIATWNVTGISKKPRKTLQNLVEVMETYKIDVLALQDTQLKGNLTESVSENTFYNSNKECSRYGVGFLVRKGLKVEFFEISGRICRIRIETESRTRTLSIVNVYAPHFGYKVKAKRIFYKKVEKHLNELPESDIKLIVGDQNSIVGNEEMYRKTTGGKSKHQECNDHGKVLVELAMENDMRIITTYFDHETIHKGTWISPDKKTINQIDHVLIETKYANLVKDVRSYVEADANTNHYLVMMKMKLDAPKSRRVAVKTTRKYDVNKLRETEVSNLLEREMTLKLEHAQKDDDIQEEWTEIEKAMIEVTENCLGKRVEINRESFAQTSRWHKSKDGVIKITGTTEKLARWEEHFTELLNEEIVEGENHFTELINEEIVEEENHFTELLNEEIVEGENHFTALLPEETVEGENIMMNEADAMRERDEITEPPTEQELGEAIDNLKNNESPGGNGIPAEVIKHGGQLLKTRLHKLMQKIWEKNEMPKAWGNAIIYPKYMKGNRKECKSHKGIACLDVVYKILAGILSDRLKKLQEKFVGEYQGAFRKGRSSVDQIFTVKMIQSKTYERKLDLHMLFIDFKQTYDSIKREKVYEAMAKLGIPNKIMDLIKMTLKNTESRVMVEGELTNRFPVTRGLRQEDPISGVLFNLILEMILRESGINTQDVIADNSGHQILAYADVVVLMSRSRPEMTRIFGLFESKAREYGLCVNEKQTKYLEMNVNVKETAEREEEMQVEISSGYCFEKVKQINFLGVTITNRGDEDTEITSRLAKGSTAYGALRKKLKSQGTNELLEIYRTSIRSIVLYAAETWAMGAPQERQLEKWEKRILTKMLGHKVRNVYPKITQVVRASRKKWLVHVMNTTDNSWPKTLLMKRNQPAIQKRHKKWINSVTKDLKEMYIKNWQKKAENEKEWEEVVKALGLSTAELFADVTVKVQRQLPDHTHG